MHRAQGSPIPMAWVANSGHDVPVGISSESAKQLKNTGSSAVIGIPLDRLLCVPTFRRVCLYQLPLPCTGFGFMSIEHRTLYNPWLIRAHSA